MYMRTVLVTGATKGIGLAVTRFLLEEYKVRVIALSRSRTPEIEELYKKHEGSLHIAACDIADEQSLTSTIQSYIEQLGSIDALVLNAGSIEPIARIADPNVPLASWRSSLEVNVLSLVVALKAAAPALRKSVGGGRVVFVSSGAAIKGTPGWGAYNAAKAAMNSICRTFAEEEPSIVSVAVRPGVVDTEMQRVIREKGVGHMTEKGHQQFVQLQADGKLVRPEQPGHVIAGLALEAPHELSGQFVSWDADEVKAFRKD
ncbi:hypothetical protein GGG16DRAFT_110220 [Schizophyllum commune]